MYKKKINNNEVFYSNKTQKLTFNKFNPSNLFTFTSLFKTCTTSLLITYS